MPIVPVSRSGNSCAGAHLDAPGREPDAPVGKQPPDHWDGLQRARTASNAKDLLDILVTHPGHRALLRRHGITSPGAILAWAEQPWRRAALTLWSGLPDTSLEAYGRRFDLMQVSGLTADEARLLHEVGIESPEQLASLEGIRADDGAVLSRLTSRMGLVRDRIRNQDGLCLNVPDEARLGALAVAAAGIRGRIRVRDRSR
ncbi:MAG: hypothetical protein VKO64_04800 [Candidatus Sericytochromatia bacterium]|nr:hypothetical protein [Candidatus Sericytochromatia bacterium]